jgi:hypothetical protein
MQVDFLADIGGVGLSGVWSSRIRDASQEGLKMAEELQIRGSQARVKVRSPWAAALLPLITLGIYHLVWWYRINCELRDYGNAKGRDLGQNPTNSLLALFPGAFIVVPALVTYWRGTQRVQEAARIAGREPVSGVLAFLLYLFLSIGFSAYLQYSLNGIWESEADPVSGELPAAAPAQVAPPSPAQPSESPDRESPSP